MDRSKVQLKSAQGVTVIELLIALTLLGVVIAIIYTLYFYGMTSFTRGDNQAIKQQEARLVAKVISEELRFASEVEVLHSLPVSLDQQDQFLLVKDGMVVKVVGGNQRIVGDGTKAGGLSLVFETDASQPTVDFAISLGTDENRFELASSVVVLNLSSTTVDNMGPILRYRTF